jgi:hypothetical protein
MPIQIGKSKRFCAFDHQLGFWQIHMASNGVNFFAIVVEKFFDSLECVMDLQKICHGGSRHYNVHAFKFLESFRRS